MPRKPAVDAINPVKAVLLSEELTGQDAQEPDAQPTLENVPAAAEVSLSSLDKDDLRALCEELNAQIIVLHGEGKHEEGDSLRVKHLNALAALKAKSNPLGYA